MAVPEVRWGNEAAYLSECIASNFVSTVGKFVGDFEARVAERMACKRGVSTVTGTAAIHLGLVALGVKPGDLVIMPSFTFIATASAVAQCGAQPWLIDIDPQTWTMDPDVVRRVLQEKTYQKNGQCFHNKTGQRVAALLPVHVLGTSAKMDALDEIAKDFGLAHIADGACAIGVTFKGEPITQFCDLTTLSFNGNKTITSGGGGMILGNDPDLMQRIHHLASTARNGPGYDHDDIGFNYRMTNIEAAVGLAQLEQLDDFLQRKLKIRERYDAALKEWPMIAGFPPYDGADSAYWLSGLVFSPDYPEAAVQLIDHLKQHNIQAGPFWKPVHLQEPYGHAICEDMTHSNALWHRIVTLPSSVSLEESQQKRVTDAIEIFLRKL